MMLSCISAQRFMPVIVSVQVESTEAAKKDAKPVRMRAGFGVFQPSRVGRLLEEAKEVNEASTSSRPPSRGSSTGADAQAPTQVMQIDPHHQFQMQHCELVVPCQNVAVN